ncbi:hypothetical protein LTR01_009168, partial [Friedmanniomyces endolithicus]
QQSVGTSRVTCYLTLKSLAEAFDCLCQISRMGIGQLEANIFNEVDYRGRDANVCWHLADGDEGTASPISAAAVYVRSAERQNIGSYRATNITSITSKCTIILIVILIGCLDQTPIGIANGESAAASCGAYGAYLHERASEPIHRDIRATRSLSDFTQLRHRAATSQTEALPGNFIY